jgi:exopolysaccharide production protein ExoY
MSSELRNDGESRCASANSPGRRKLQIQGQIMKSGDVAEHASSATLERDDAMDGFLFPSTANAAPVGGTPKRCFDVAVATTALVLLAPLFVAIIFLLALTSRGPVFYRHNRIGFRGKEFGCIKFRTMRVSSEEAFDAYLQQNCEARKEWNETRKLKHDPRVTPVGAFLRKASLDELPQLINVIRGEMSLVGPRPVTGPELEQYGRYSAYYLQTRPGLTGAWQISGRSDTSYQERVTLDTHYVRDWSFGVDLKILILTVPCVIAAKGSC